MEIGNSYGVQSLWDLTSATKVDATHRYTKVESEVTSSGDSISISDEAKKLYSEMIHKYDHSSRSDAAEENGAGADVANETDSAGSATEAAPQGSGGAGSSGLSGGSGDSVESIKKQIQSLKSQLAALASQAGSGNQGVMSKMDALQSQIAALEAQLNEMESAG